MMTPPQFDVRERRRLKALQRRVSELKRRLAEPSYVGPSRSYAAAEAVAIAWALKILQADQGQSLQDIVLRERSTRGTS